MADSEKSPLLQNEPNSSRRGAQYSFDQKSGSLPDDSPVFQISEPGDEKDDSYTLRSHASVNTLVRSFTQTLTTSGESMMHVFNGNIGTGILAMPTAFMNAGLWVGFAGLFVIGIIATHCMHLLVICSRNLCDRTGAISLDYADVALAAFKLGPLSTRRLANAMRLVVLASLLLTQLGFCTVYVLFIADNLDQVVEAATGFHMDVRIYALIVLFLLIPYVFVGNLKTLAYFSVAANIFTVLGLAIIFYNLSQDIPDASIYPAAASIETLPLYFGQAVYSFEGISLILPIENKMRHRDDFGGCTGVLTTSMAIVTILYVSVGFFGYLKYGAAVKLGSITLNLPLDNWLYLMVKLTFAFTVFLTYGLQFYVPIKLIWPWMSELVDSEKWRRYGHYLLRLTLLFLTFCVAIAVPKLDLMISLIGALCSSCLALIFPPILDIVTFWSVDLGRCNWRLFKDIFIIMFGVLGFLTGTYTSIVNIVASFSSEGD